MIGIQAARPPFVEFKQVPRHDPKKSEELGYRVTKDIDMAFIMQPGSKDCIEIEADKWLASIRRKNVEATPDAYPSEWVDGFNKKYQAWKEGLQAPEIGTSVREWPILSPAQAENLINLRIPTIEDVAQMNEESMGRFGMGARELREKARQWIGQKEISSTLQVENDELKAKLADLEAKVAELLENKPKRGRPPKLKAA